jgi:hypothetical protein
MTDFVEKIFNKFDNNVKLIEYNCTMETFLKLTDSQNNINRINTLLLDSSKIVYFNNIVESYTFASI